MTPDPTKVPLHVRQQWPKLSETLAGPREPDVCQACGFADPSLWDLERWIECDEWDRPTSVVVVLCHSCAQQLIKPHPRLYKQLWRFDPWPGVMPICLGCRWRDGLRCTHALLRANGGPGLPIHVPQGIRTHLNYGGGRGEWRTMRDRWPSQCDGREETPHA